MAIEEIEIEGYLGQDPTRPSLEKCPNLVSFSVGVTQSIKNKQTGDWDSKTTWYKVNSWIESRVDYLCNNLKKGDKVVIKGRPEVSSWKDNDGNPKAEITVHLDKIVMPSKKDIAVDSSRTYQQHRDIKLGNGSIKDSLDDVIPF